MSVSDRAPFNAGPTDLRPSRSPPLGDAELVVPPAAMGRAADEGVTLRVNSLYKIFAADPQPALTLIKEGKAKEQVLQAVGAVVAVQDASFAIRTGEIFVVMGLSGSGKSTLVRMINRLIEPTSGEILFDGRDLTRMDSRELREVRLKDMSMVFQSFALMPHLTALDNAALGLKVAGMAKPKRRDAAMQALQQVGLAAFAERYPREMSGGMQQRLGLARALAKNPSIMLMDEAFSALDPLIRWEMQSELLRLQREQRRTIVFISHDLDEAIRIGDRIAIMEGGRVVQVGTPAEILRNPANDYVRAFFRNVDLTRVLTAGDLADAKLGQNIVRTPGDLTAAHHQLVACDQSYGYVHDQQNRFQGVVSRDSLARALGDSEPRFRIAFLDHIRPVRADTPLQQAIEQVARCECPVPVVDDLGTYLGVISRATLLVTLVRGERNEL